MTIDPHVVTPAKARAENRKLAHAYAGFQAATALVVMARAPALRWPSLIVSLIAVSIPSTIAYAGLARLLPEDEQRNPASVAFICFLLAFIPSIAAVSLVLASASKFAAAIFPAMCVAWCVTVVMVRRRESH